MEPMSDPHPFRDLLPGYSLGILDEEETSVVKKHLADCADCRAELASFHEVTGALAAAVPQRDLPAGLEARILRAVERAPSPRPTEERFSGGRPVRPARSRSPWPALTGIAAAVAVLLGAVNLMQWNGVLGPAGKGGAPRLAMAVLSGTDGAPEAYGTIVLDPKDNKGVLAVTGLPALGADRQYQLWLIRDGQRRSAGVFTPDSEGYGSMLLTVPTDFRDFLSFGVSVEPRGGSSAPTGPGVLAGKL
jgi:anti-sigma-K factor RskA